MGVWHGHVLNAQLYYGIHIVLPGNGKEEVVWLLQTKMRDLDTMVIGILQLKMSAHYKLYALDCITTPPQLQH